MEGLVPSVWCHWEVVDLSGQALVEVLVQLSSYDLGGDCGILVTSFHFASQPPRGEPFPTTCVLRALSDDLVEHGPSKL